MNLEPLPYLVLMKRETPEEKKGGIFLPESAKKAPNFGEIIWVGKKCGDLKPGDKIYIRDFPYPEIKAGEETLYVVEYKDIFARVIEDGQ